MVDLQNLAAVPGSLDESSDNKILDVNVNVKII